MRVSQVDAELLENWRIIEEFLTPALAKIESFSFLEEETCGGDIVLTACVNAYKADENPDLPVQLFDFAHRMRLLKDVVLEFKEHSEIHMLLKKMLSSIGISEKVQKLITKNPQRLAYSGLVSFLAQKDHQLQSDLIEVLEKVRYVDDPTDAVAKLVPLLQRNKIVTKQLLSIDGSIDLTLDELLAILDVAGQFKRTDLIEMMAKPCTNWLTFAEQK